jgi:large subunit ribosomal protein L18
MNKQKLLNQTRLRRKERARVKIFGTPERPRLSVFRSNQRSYAQLIDDRKGVTLANASTPESKKRINKVESAKQLGELIAQEALKKGIKKAVFDRGRYKYHGRVKAVAEGAKTAGLEF